MIRGNRDCSRRTALKTIAGAALASAAGCLQGDTTPTDGSSSSDGQNVLQRVAVDGTELAVELSGETDIDQINLVQPNGEAFGQRTVAAGSQRVSFEIGTSYEPGEYAVVALSGDEPVVERTVSIEPDLRIADMGIGRNQPEKMWDGEEDKISQEAFVTVENQGSGPDSISKLLFLGDVPYPSDEDGTNYAEDKEISGIYDPESGSEVDDVIVQAGEQVDIYSSRSPFAFVPGAGTSCTDQRQTGEFELILETQVGEPRLTETYSIQYSPLEQSESCEISISEG